MKISLTFDNGPNPEVTPKVLDALAAAGVKATFFIVGERLEDERCLTLIARARDEGHRIGNHTYSHRMFGTMAALDEAVSEIERTQKALGAAANEDRLFRPAGGGGLIIPDTMTRSAFNYLLDHKYSCVLWNCVPRDWEEPSAWSARALADLRTRDWQVLVIHDHLPNGAMDALPEFLREAQALGAEFTQEFPLDCAPIWRGSARWEPPISEDIAA